jgi:hypothetical protein
VQVVHQLQVGNRVLDFGALEEALAAIHAIGNGRAEQRMFDHPRLRIGAVEHGDLAARPAFGDQVLDLFDDPLRFLQVAGGFIDAHLLAVAGIGAQVLAQALAVVGDQFVGGIQDVAVRAVVLLQLDQVLDVEFRSKADILPTLAPRKA